MNPPSSNDQTAHLGPDFLYFLHAPSLASGGSFFDNPVKTEHSLTKREQAASTGDLRRNPEQYREADGLTWPGFLMLENPHDVCLDSSLHPFKAKAAEAAVELELSRRCSGRHLPCVRGNSLRGGTAEGAVPGTVVAALPLEVQAAVKRYECGRGAPWNDGPQGSLLKHWQSAQGALSAPATTQKAESAFAFLDGRASAQYFNAALMQKVRQSVADVPQVTSLLLFGILL
uniref:Uncharacterized protein n=1 Tax=Chromera velia CCMP2878 TaxID=1169474 RepID=A0A0K6SBA0_9ALVE|eukprot:Cvel_2407.t1-p1 / transcript=Cvel_2407.t1 / gene=Cvel_2407 / organism=Chromera_velia_CCMP2878 / gene_product=hypothetical protein / transcript_product=hypothetical protein / location=Cvel_scaffold94:24177-25815(-) / protein_length=229 / sequence_SO=supercontig / SO=protein_coding / is_pseudo=false